MPALQGVYKPWMAVRHDVQASIEDCSASLCWRSKEAACSVVDSEIIVSYLIAVHVIDCLVNVAVTLWEAI